MKKIVIILLNLVISHLTLGQTLNDPLYISFTRIPSAAIKQGSGNVTFNFIELNIATPPINNKGKIKLINSLYYRYSDLHFQNSQLEKEGFPQSLHDLRYTAILRIPLAKDWEIVTIPRIMVRSDLQQDFSGKDLFPQVVALANYSINKAKNFKIGLGLALNNDFERNSVFPIGSLTYEDANYKVEIVYPNANFLYKKNADFEIGLFSTVDGSISRIKPNTGRREEEYFRNFQLLIAPTVSYRIAGSIYGHLKVGYAPVRSFEKLNAQFQPEEGRDYEVTPSFFFRAGLSLRIKQ